MNVDWFQELLTRSDQQFADFKFSDDDADSDGIVSWFEFSLPKGEKIPASVEMMIDPGVYDAHYNPPPSGFKSGDLVPTGSSSEENVERDTSGGSATNGGGKYDMLLNALSAKQDQAKAIEQIDERTALDVLRVLR